MWGNVKGLTNGGERYFYGIIQRILQLEYHDFNNKVSLFYFAWFDPINNSGTRVINNYNIVDIKMNKWYHLYGSFIHAQEAKQVYYLSYPDMCRNLCGWCVSITTKPRGYMEIYNTEIDGWRQNEWWMMSQNQFLKGLFSLCFFSLLNYASLLVN